MRLSSVLLSLAATGALCSPTASVADPTAEKCAELEALGQDQGNPLSESDATALRKCGKHPAELGLVSSLYNPDEKANLTSPANRGKLLDELTGLQKRAYCQDGGRGHGWDYDYGCTNGWCWRNCEGPFNGALEFRKTWCWLAYEAGSGGWTPCGRWQDCEWSYNNKNAKCAKGNCKSCGCGC
ncbi:hypothetical protein COCSADRAFT_38606 [Bipolaris sorokiniana ND90Pr]|uniref:IDI-2 n=1 Tax=Cochliobolus sativus (strain ND90Pr / ATCC 201652) TaxID=665912 RepID=M2SH80_COCSN|nr:uncharacterized protein COCSADRAFT_38606 [Bipolaris sorokiniana ND90Pr]EMD61770.1 hypothetical protein COCSADRAFT_38606 [Bipolaris sorokiniana ND90Pr]